MTLSSTTFPSADGLWPGQRLALDAASSVTLAPDAQCLLCRARSGCSHGRFTDHNPDTSLCLSLLLMVSMACTLFRLTVPEALAGLLCMRLQPLVQ